MDKNVLFLHGSLGCRSESKNCDLLGDADRMAAGGAYTALVESRGRSLGRLGLGKTARLHLCVGPTVGAMVVHLRPGRHRRLGLAACLVMGRPTAAKQHGRGSESLEGDREHHEACQKQAKANHFEADSKRGSAV